MRNIEWIIFDWDDVFTLGSKEWYYKCYLETLEELWVSLPFEEADKRIQAKWWQSHREELKELLKEKPELIDRACEIYEAKLFWGTFTSCLSLVKWAVDTLLILSNEWYNLSVATGLNSKLFREQIVPRFDIPDVFSQVISAYDIPDPTKAKPHPYMAKQILTQQNLSSDKVILVWDAWNDVWMAQSLWITPIVVLTWHLDTQQAIQLWVQHIINDVSELPKFLWLNK